MSGSETAKYEVIVVGSGPAGVSTAMHLAKLAPGLGDRIIVLEKATHPRTKLCGGGIGAYADYWLERLDIRISIPSLELKRTYIVVDHNEYVEHILRCGSLRTVLREEFDEALVRKAMAMGIAVAQNEPVISFSYHGNAVVVRSAKRNLKAKVLVGADGAKSTIRRNLCRDLATRGPTTVCSTLRFMEQADKTNSPEYGELVAVADFSCAFERGIQGYAWACPVMIWGQPWLNTGIVGFNRSRGRGYSLRQILEEFLATRGICIDPSRLEGHPIRWFDPASIFSTNRVLFVGDAAGIDPLWGEGISFCLGYGEVAARSILHALESNDFSFLTYKEELLKHEVGKELMNRLALANKLYRSQITENVRDHLLSILSPR